jgi:hypothetical protein
MYTLIVLTFEVVSLHSSTLTESVFLLFSSPLLECSLEWLLHGDQKMHACQEPNNARVLFSLSIWTRSEDQHGDLWLLARLLVAVQWRGPEIWPHVWILHQDSTSAQDMPSSAPLWNHGRIPGRGSDFSLLQITRTRSWVRLAFSSVITRGCFIGSKVVGVWSWPLTCF